MTDQGTPEDAQGHEPNPEEESATEAGGLGHEWDATAPEEADEVPEGVVAHEVDDIDDVDAGETSDAAVWRPVPARPRGSASRSAAREEPHAPPGVTRDGASDPDARTDPGDVTPDEGVPLAEHSPHQDRRTSADGVMSGDPPPLPSEAPPANVEWRDSPPWPIPPGDLLPGEAGSPDPGESPDSSAVLDAEDAVARTSERADAATSAGEVASGSAAGAACADDAVIASDADAGSDALTTAAVEADDAASEDSAEPAPEAEADDDRGLTGEEISEPAGESAAEEDLSRLGAVAEPEDPPDTERAPGPRPLPRGERVNAAAEVDEQIEHTSASTAMDVDAETVAETSTNSSESSATHEGASAREDEVPDPHEETRQADATARGEQVGFEEAESESAARSSSAGDDDDPRRLLPGGSEPDAATAMVAASARPVPPVELVADEAEPSEPIAHAATASDAESVEKTTLECADQTGDEGAGGPPGSSAADPEQGAPAAEAPDQADPEQGEPARRDPSRRSLREKHRAERRAAREAAAAAAAAATEARSEQRTSGGPSDDPPGTAATETGDRWWKPLTSFQEEAAGDENPARESTTAHATARHPEPSDQGIRDESHGLDATSSDDRRVGGAEELTTGPDVATESLAPDSGAALVSRDTVPNVAVPNEAVPNVAVPNEAEGARSDAPSPFTLDVPQVTPAQIAAEALPPVPDRAPTFAPGAVEAPAPFEAPHQLAAAPPLAEEGAASAARRRGRRRRGITGLVAGGLVVVLAGYVAADVTDLVPGVLTTDPPRPGPVAFPHPTPAADGEGTAFPPVDADAPIPDPATLAAIFDGAFDEEVVDNISIDVQDAFTGEELHTQDPANPRTPASVTKVLTAAAGLSELGADSRLDTTALLDGETVVLRGGGDVLLGTGESDPGAIDGRAGLETLGVQAAEQLRSRGITRVSVVRDESLYTGDGLHDTWEPSDVGNGFVAPISPLMVSAGRTDPSSNASRTGTPGLFAAEAFAGTLQAEGIEVVGDAGEAITSEGAEELAVIHSAPVSSIVEFLLVHSDNVVSESLGRQVALARGEEPDFAGAATAVEGALVDLGVDRGEISLTDLSGLSYDNQISPADVATLFSSAVQDGGSMAALPASLPVAGWSGTLSDRFGTSGAEAGAGVVRAKTGTLRSVASLAGTLVTEDGRLLTFAIMADELEPEEAAAVRRDVDLVLAQIVECGCS